MQLTTCHTNTHTHTPSTSLSITRPYSAWFPNDTVIQTALRKPAAVRLRVLHTDKLRVLVISRFVEPSKNQVPNKLYSYPSIPSVINYPREIGNNPTSWGH